MTQSPLVPVADAPVAAPGRVPGLFGRGMPRRVGPLLSLFARRFLDRIPFPEDVAARVKALHAGGATIVYVHRARNPVEHLALSRAVARQGLPRALFVGGLNTLALQPLAALPRMLVERSHDPRREEALLERCMRAGAPAEVFLRRPLTLLSTHAEYKARFIDVLVRVQREAIHAGAAQRILLVPCFLALKQRPGRFEPTPLDAVFGSVEEPGLLRALGRVIAAGAQARFEISEPVDLAELVRGADKPDDVIAKKVRWLLLRHLASVERVAHGPPLKSHARLKAEVQRDPHLGRTIDALAQAGPKPRTALEHDAGKMYEEIAARFDVDLAQIFSKVLDVIWRRIYDAIHVDEAEIRRVREAARRGPLVLVPSHRSHVDYLVLSQVMLKGGMLPPFIAAGENLSFFPLGPIFRRGGAYFLRRSFKGDPLYGAVFRAYVRQLFNEGVPQEFFIEGGRSRTGKTLPPKLGLLGMIVDAYAEGRADDAIFLPCHIAYERIVEAAAYVGELGGKAKEKESARGLLSSFSVLTRRYGSVFVTFDEPISLKDHLAARGVHRGTKDAAPGAEALRAAVQALGHRIVYGINQSGVVTTTAVVCATLLALRRPAVDEVQLVDACIGLVAHLRTPPKAPRFDPVLAAAAGASELRVALTATIARLVNDGIFERTLAGERTLLGVAKGQALVVDTHKNQLLHHVVPEAIVACALPLAGRDAPNAASRAEVKRRALALSRAFRLEFIFRASETGSAQFPELFDEAVALGCRIGFLETAVAPHDGLTVPGTAPARAAHRFARGLLLNFVDAYAFCLRTLRNSPGLAAQPERARIQGLLDGLKAAVLTGEVGAAEAANKALVENAVRLFAELTDTPQKDGERGPDPLTAVLDALIFVARPPSR